MTVDWVLVVATWTCAPCHGHIHDHPAWAYEHGWLRRKGTT